MKIEIINTGTEILLGHVTNTHLSYLAHELFSIGHRVERQCTVPDGEAIRNALQESFERADVIVVTGGLGPTSDDMTREIVAELTRLPLLFHQEIWDHIQDRFHKRGKVAGENTKKQAYVPQGALFFQNQNGTAPGLIINHQLKTIVLLPGPPRELTGMWENQIFPWLKQHCFQSTHLVQKQWRIIGIGESEVEAKIEAPLRALGDSEIGYCARAGEVDLRIISSDPTFLQKAHELITQTFGSAIYCLGTESMEEIVVHLAQKKSLKIATAESCTGGLIAHRLTQISGSSQVFGFGWVTYENEAKIQELGVSRTLIETKGAVSQECVEAMAKGALQQSRADIAVAVSGIAGPTGGTSEKPVGTCWISWATPKKVRFEKKVLSQNRDTFKQMASQYALQGIRLILEEM